MPSAVVKSKLIRQCTQPCPKWPYVVVSYLYLVRSFLKPTRYAERFSGGTAESSQPSHVSAFPGTNAVAPSPESRTFQILTWSSCDRKSFMEGPSVVFSSSCI